MAIDTQQKNLLDDLLARLRHACGDNLDSLVLYGSAAGDGANGFHAEFSDLNVLCLVKRLDSSALQKISPVVAWWEKLGQPAPMLFTIRELRESADVFAIELYDIKAKHKVLFGADHFPEFEVPMSLHRVAVERDLRTNLIRLRQRYMAAAGDGSDKVLTLMTDSVSTFITMFRHSLIAMQEQPPRGKREVVDMLAGMLGFDRKAFESILDLREGKLRRAEIEVSATFDSYLKAIESVVEKIDKQLA